MKKYIFFTICLLSLSACNKESNAAMTPEPTAISYENIGTSGTTVKPEPPIISCENIDTSGTTVKPEPPIISCENIDTSGVDKKMLKQVLATMSEMQEGLSATMSEMQESISMGFDGDAFVDAMFFDPPYEDLFYYYGPSANSQWMEIQVKHIAGGENLVINGSKRKILFHQCIIPVAENARPAFCCAVQELDPPI